jgi:UDP-N-acetylglucosamine:LPS N-acetylglucosamine transferase
MKVLAVLGDGGHSAEMIRLLELLGSGYAFSYLLSTVDAITESKLPWPGPVYRVPEPLGKHAGQRRWPYALWASVQQFGVLARVRPRVIITSGANIAVPVSLFGRLCGVKIVFIETGSRVRTLSATGKFMYRIAHLFLVQWEPLLRDCPRAVYAGRLL